MTGPRQDSLAARRLFIWSTLTFGAALAPVSSSAAEDFFRFGAPFALSKPVIGGETRIPAARPASADSARANDMTRSADNPEPEGRLRLKPMAFGGM